MDIEKFGFDDLFRICFTLLVVILVAFFISPISTSIFIFSIVVLIFISVLELIKYVNYVKKPKKSKQ